MRGHIVTVKLISHRHKTGEATKVTLENSIELALTDFPSHNAPSQPSPISCSLSNGERCRSDSNAEESSKYLVNKKLVKNQQTVPTQGGKYTTDDVFG